MNDLLRRAWNALDTFKQAYSENWHEEDEQVLKDLLKADLKLSGVKLKWQGLTDEEMHACWDSPLTPLGMKHARMIEAKLKEKNG